MSTTTKKDELMDLRIAVAALKEDVKALAKDYAELRASVVRMRELLEEKGIHDEPPVVYTDIYR